MQISKEVLRFLTCPVTNKGLVYDQENDTVVSCAAALAFPIVNGIPILLKEQATPVDPEKLQQLKKISAEDTRKAKQLQSAFQDELQTEPALATEPQVELEQTELKTKQQAEAAMA